MQLVLALAAIAAVSSPDVVPGRILIRPAAAPKTDADAATLVAGIATAARVPLVLDKRTVASWLVVHVDNADAAQTVALAHRLSSTKGVLAAEPDVRLHALLSSNDPLLSKLWGFDAIEAESAWDTTTGIGAQRIGLVDTGIRRNHVDLAPKDVAGFDFVSDPQNAGDGDGRDNDYSDEGGDDDYHGSHVAGTMLARGNDHHGVAGVNWNAGLVTARSLGIDGGGDLVDIVEGAAWLAGFDIDGVPSIGADKASVINMSLGGSGACSKFEHDAMKQILDSGVVVVAAAGNDGGPTGSPANCPGVIAVAAVGSDLALADYSSFDHRIDVVAPGGDASAMQTGDASSGILSVDGATKSGYKVLVGTSMAAPHVSGVVSLMQAVNPSITPAQVRTILKASPYTCDGCDSKAFLQADAAVTAAKALTSTPAPASGSHGSHGGAHAHDGSETDGSCDPARGNWDCPANQGCVDGICVEGEQGRAKLGDACNDDAQCSSGLCDRNVCTRPCDADGCPTGAICDASAIPGGMCRVPAPLSCASTDAASIADFSALLPGAAWALFQLGCVHRRRRARA
jgi:serine protease